MAQFCSGNDSSDLLPTCQKAGNDRIALVLNNDTAIVRNNGHSDSPSVALFSRDALSPVKKILPPTGQVAPQYQRLKLVKRGHMAVFDPMVCGLSFEGLPA